MAMPDLIRLSRDAVRALENRSDSSLCGVTKTAFNVLPMELNERIATYLETDLDIFNFMLICRTTYEASRSHRCGLWRHLFARRFDIPSGNSGIELKLKYQIRSKFLRRNREFHLGLEPCEEVVLNVIKDLVKESYTDVPVGFRAKRLAKNIREIEKFVRSSDLIHCVFGSMYYNDEYDPLMQTLQVLFTHLHLDQSLARPTFGFRWSQQAVYSHPEDFPLFFIGREEINMNFVLHLVNFWKQHMTQPRECTLFNLMSELEDHEKPRAWENQLYVGVHKLGRHWKGSYAYLHDPEDVSKLRDLLPDECHKEYFTDTIDYEDGLQTMELDFSPAANTAPWPRSFEDHLHAMPSVSHCIQVDYDKEPEKHIARQRPHRRPRDTSAATIHIGDEAFEVPPEFTLETPPETPSTNRAPITITIPETPPPLTAPLTPALTSPKRGIHYHRFCGTGTDLDTFGCMGILHALPPQSGIDGWQRISFMKHFGPLVPAKRSMTISYRPLPDLTPSTASSASPSSSHAGCYANTSPASSLSSTTTTTSPEEQSMEDLWPYPLDEPVTQRNHGLPSPDAIKVNFGPPLEGDFEVDVNCWAYEGVVLPGGKIILGRWWSPTEDRSEHRCVGPFIFWNVGDDVLE